MGIRAYRQMRITSGQAPGAAYDAAQDGTMNKSVFSVIGLLVLGACATPYQEMTFQGGVEGHRITADTAQIIARGNSLTDPDKIQRYVLRRAAEETLQDGFDVFQIVENHDRTRTGEYRSGYATGNRRFAWIGGFSAPVVAPGEALVIHMTKGPKPNPTPEGVYDAHEIMQFMVFGEQKKPAARP
jgi:hypothetical protein